MSRRFDAPCDPETLGMLPHDLLVMLAARFGNLGNVAHRRPA